jgi:hypothetical protein
VFRQAEGRLGITALSADSERRFREGDNPMTTVVVEAMPDPSRIRVLLAGPDTLYFSCDLPISEQMRDLLHAEKTVAQAVADQRRVHRPEWLGARVCPQGAKGVTPS